MSPIVITKRGKRRGHPAGDLQWQIEQGLRMPSVDVQREVRFHTTRKWKIDLVVDAIGRPPIAVEIEGGLFLKEGGRHNRGAGMKADILKYNEIVLAGFLLLRVLPEWVASGQAFTLVERAVKGTK